MEDWTGKSWWLSLVTVEALRFALESADKDTGLTRHKAGWRIVWLATQISLDQTPGA